MGLHHKKSDNSHVWLTKLETQDRISSRKIVNSETNKIFNRLKDDN